MGQRLQLQTLLEGLLGSRNVYFQPPASVSMNYPAIVYSRDTEDVKFADNKPYSREKRYTVTHISRDPESDVLEKLAELPKCRFSRHFTADNLHHDAYTLYY